MKNNIKLFIRTVVYCSEMSWTASSALTILRAIALSIRTITPFFSLMVTKKFLDLLSNSNNTEASLTNSIVLLIIITFLICVNKALDQMIVYFQKVHNGLLEKMAITKIMEKSLTIDVEFFDLPDYLDILHAVNTDFFSLCTIVWNIFLAISGLISLIISFCMIFSFNYLYAVILFLTSLPATVVSHHFSKASHELKLSSLTNERQQGYIRSISNSDQFAFDIRLFNISEFLISRYSKLWEICFAKRKVLNKKQLQFIVPAYLLPEVVSFIFLLFVTLEVISGEKPIGDFSFYSGLFSALINATSIVISQIGAIYEDKLKVTTVQNFNNYKAKVLDDGQTDLKEINEIEFKNVFFKYPNTDRYVLNGISFKISKNQKVCMVGENGAGKSSIIKLLLRFYEATDGVILINSYNINTFTLESLRRSCCALFQNNVPYAFTLRENINLSDINRNSTEEELLAALRFVNASEMLEKLSYGLDTHIYRFFSKEGYEPSGGESQKIALARVLFRDCSVIILDEPTSSLDPVSQSILYANIFDILKNRTVLFISHRLFSARKADNILVVDSGRIIECGKHDELMKLKGKYSHLYRLQVDSY